MKSVVIIPARYDSSRLPGKALLRATGKYLVQHVYEQACQAQRPSGVVVATDDPRIEAAVRGFGGLAALTRRDHQSGTDRVAEVAATLDADVIVNLQGDEPLIDPAALDGVIDVLTRHPQAVMATLATPITSEEHWRSPHCVKVVLGADGQALYFSRSPIPYCRDGEPNFARPPRQYFQHVGLYAYRRTFLEFIAKQAPSALEQTEKLEQLRVLDLGYRIQVGVVAHATLGVDTPADYDRFVRQYRATQRLAA